jgi:hypothetical protein
LFSFFLHTSSAAVIRSQLIVIAQVAVLSLTPPQEIPYNHQANPIFKQVSIAQKSAIMDLEYLSKKELNLRELPTKSVTLFPSKAQVIRNVNSILLQPGANQVIITGITPTADEHSIKVEGTGTATITDLNVALVPNLEVYDDIYPDDAASDYDAEDAESDAEIEETAAYKAKKKEIAELQPQELDLYEQLGSISNRLNTLEKYLPQQAEYENIDLEKVMNSYYTQRAKLYEDRKSATAKRRETEAQIGKLQKELRRLGEETLKARRKAEKEKAKEKEKKDRKLREKLAVKTRRKEERSKFWPKKVWQVTISIEAPSGFAPAGSRRGSVDSLVTLAAAPESKIPSTEPAEVSLSLSYITYAASWSPRYDLSLNTIKNIGTLDYSAELKNETSETWSGAKIVLSTSQTSYQGLGETIPVLQPWHVYLAKGRGSGTSGALKSRYETNQQKPSIPPQFQAPREELFGYGDNFRYGNACAPKKTSEGGPVISMQYNQAPLVQACFAALPPPPAMAPRSSAFGGAVLGSTRMVGSVSKRRMAQAPGGYMEGSEDYSAMPKEDYSEEDEAASQLDWSQLKFEESSFEEAGMTTTYDLPSAKTIAPATTSTKHKIARIDFKAVVFSHILVPKLKASAFLKASLRNASKITLLKGTAGLTLDGSFLGNSTIPRCSAGDAFTLPLGVDPAITVTYAKPTVRRSSTGLFSKEDCEVYTRVATITNTKNNNSVDITLLDQIPISEDERLRIEILTPRGLKTGGEGVPAGVEKEPDTSAVAVAVAASRNPAGSARMSVYGDNGKKSGAWGSAIATMKKEGEINWKVKINPGRGCKLVLEYETTYPGGETVFEK